MKLMDEAIYNRSASPLKEAGAKVGPRSSGPSSKGKAPLKRKGEHHKGALWYVGRPKAYPGRAAASQRIDTSRVADATYYGSGANTAPQSGMLRHVELGEVRQ